MPDAQRIDVQICYAGKAGISLLSLQLAPQTTILQAIQQSGIIDIHPEIDVSIVKVGVFGKLKTLDAVLHAGDRIEIYRSLIADPMEARRRRAHKQLQAG
ncbi:MAG: RnfH family protein [Burkholderiales bacterium]|nr:RnfH family protein [Burkholderiales bacterium]